MQRNYDQHKLPATIKYYIKTKQIILAMSTHSQTKWSLKFLYKTCIPILCLQYVSIDHRETFVWWTPHTIMNFFPNSNLIYWKTGIYQSYAYSLLCLTNETMIKDPFQLTTNFSGTSKQFNVNGKPFSHWVSFLFYLMRFLMCSLLHFVFSFSSYLRLFHLQSKCSIKRQFVQKNKQTFV